SAPDIVIAEAWAAATPKGASTGAGYLTIVNNGSVADRLVAASSPVAETVMFHQSGDDNGVMRMQMLPTVDVPAGGSVTLKPGAVHLMMAPLKGQLAEGQTFPLTL